VELNANGAGNPSPDIMQADRVRVGASGAPGVVLLIDCEYALIRLDTGGEILYPVHDIKLMGQ
jgi:hypothetical protein